MSKFQLSMLHILEPSWFGPRLSLQPSSPTLPRGPMQFCNDMARPTNFSCSHGLVWIDLQTHPRGVEAECWFLKKFGLIIKGWVMYSKHEDIVGSFFFTCPISFRNSGLKHGVAILLSLNICFSRSEPGSTFCAPKPLRTQHVQQLCE